MAIPLARHPFTPPEPWHVAVVIDFAQIPRGGRLTLGRVDVDLTAGLRAASGASTVVVGTRCDGTYAFHQP
jgi:hypothetical protein